MQRVCVYCASSSGLKKTYFDAAERLGKVLADAGIAIVCGAGNQGLMGTLADSAMHHNGHVIGIIPQFMCDEDWHHTELSELIVVNSMHERKEKMASMSDAAIALPGGCGTMEELLEVITWKQLGLYPKPIVIVNTDGYYDDLIALLNKAVGENFMREIHKSMWEVVDTPEQVPVAIANAVQWTANARSIAAIKR